MDLYVLRLLLSGVAVLGAEAEAASNTVVVEFLLLLAHLVGAHSRRLAAVIAKGEGGSVGILALHALLDLGRLRPCMVCQQHTLLAGIDDKH